MVVITQVLYPLGNAACAVGTWENMLAKDTTGTCQIHKCLNKNGYRLQITREGMSIRYTFNEFNGIRNATFLNVGGWHDHSTTHFVHDLFSF